MQDVFSNLPNIVAVATAVAAGSAAAFGIFDKKLKDRRQADFNERDLIENKIRDLYQEAQLAQDKKIEQLVKQVDELTKNYLKQKGENEVLVRIFQGRDDESVEYRKRGYETFDLAAKIGNIIVNNTEMLEKILENLAIQGANTERLAIAIERQVEHLDRGKP